MSHLSLRMPDLKKVANSWGANLEVCKMHD